MEFNFNKKKYYMSQTTNSPKTFRSEKHRFHIVRPSPWPFLTSISLFNLAVCLILIFNYFEVSNGYLLFSFLHFISIIGMWFRDVIIESHQGMHTLRVQRNFRYGMMIFLVSEGMFFFGFFWCYFYMSIAPSIWIGSVWPPVGIKPINPLHLPLLNTAILISSGFSAVYTHKCIMREDGRIRVFWSLSLTIMLGILFTFLQYVEYKKSLFSINDGIYGSIFYVSTGFHGIHVIIGTLFLTACLIRHAYHHFLRDHHIGLELCFWYWHFVDAVWIALYLVVYWMGWDWSLNPWSELPWDSPEELKKKMDDNLLPPEDLYVVKEIYFDYDDFWRL